MKLSLKETLLAGTILAGAAMVGGVTSAAANVCPAVGLDTDCRLTITLPPSGMGTIATDTTVSPTYDGSDDTLIGVANNSGVTINVIHLDGDGHAIFAFDGDGAGGPSRLNLPGDTGSSHAGYSGTDSTTGSFDLSGPLNFFSNIVGNNGDVNFPGGLVNGGTAFFSLESPLTAASFTVTASVPEPTSLSILGAALAGFGLLRRRRKA